MLFALRTRLSALHAATFAGIGVAMPFFPVWLESRGLGAGTIGIVLALPIMVRILVTAPLVDLTDRGLGLRRLLVGAQIGVALGYVALLGASGALAIAALVALIAAAQAPLVPAADLATTNAVREHPGLDYGQIRLWGSIAFLVSSVGAGYLLAAAPVDAIVWSLVGFALIGALVALAAPDSGGGREGAGAPPGRARLPPALLWLIVGAALIQASHAAVYGFGSIHWRAQGFSGPAIGYLWAIGVVVEIVLFWALGRLVGRGGAAIGLMIAGAGAAVLRFGGLALGPSLETTMLLQALHGVSFGATHLGAMAALTSLAPPGARGRAQGLLSAAAAMALAAGMAASGWLYRNFEALAFAAMTPLALAGLGCALVAARALAAQPQRAGIGG